MTLKDVWDMVKETATKWIDDKAPRLGAALAYYTVFAIAPVLVIAIAIAGMVFGREAAHGAIFTQLAGLVGVEGADIIQTALKNSYQEGGGIIATTVGVIALLIGATGVFVEIQDALNTIWGVVPKPGRGIKGLLKDRLLSFAMILGVGFILMVSLVISAVLNVLNDFIGRLVPSLDTVILLQVVNIVISLAIFTVLLATIYKVLPDVQIAWRDVWIGAAITAVLFTAGKFLIGLYLGKSSVATTYGAAGSLAVLLVWVYYTSQILFFGAEFTQVFANRYGSRVLPGHNAIMLNKKICITPEETPPELAGKTGDEKAERISQ